MKLFARLPANRYEAGELWAEKANERRVFGPVRARGEADNTGAATHDNPGENPTQLYGDHPAGLYRVVAVEDKGFAKYGPAFLLLDPQEGEALEGKLHGRSGIGIHGGRLHADGRLRETFGCLRIDNRAMEDLAALVSVELDAGREVLYQCLIAEVPLPSSSVSAGAGGSAPSAGPTDAG